MPPNKDERASEPAAESEPAASSEVVNSDSGTDVVPGPTSTQRMKTPRQTRLGRFPIEEKIGEGGMGVVYRGYDPDLHREVAIKKILPALADSEEYAQRFLSEARAVAAVMHPNIAQIFSIHASEPNAPPFFVMEFVDGESAEARVKRRGPLPPAEALDIILQAARGLRAAHLRGLVHRDVKPSNILINKRGEVKLVDFGLARNLEAVSTHTEAGVILGTPHFVSPEQGRGRSADHRSDIYSLACTLYFLLTGEEPFRGETKVEVIVAHANEPPPFASKRDPEIPSSVDAVLQRCLAKQPEDRYQTYDDLIDAIQVLQKSLGLPRRRNYARKAGTWLAAGALAVGLLFVSYGAYALLFQRRTNDDIYSPQHYFGDVYTPREDSEILFFDFAGPHRTKLDRFFRYPHRSDDPYYRPPAIRGNALRWSNFTDPVTFPYLDEFQEIELDSIRFSGRPDFEILIGYDPLFPVNYLRAYFRVGEKNSKILECRRQGDLVPIKTDQSRVDFTLEENTEYKIRLVRGPETAAGKVPFVLTVLQEMGNHPVERAHISFQIDRDDVPHGEVTLRAGGSLSRWNVSVGGVLIQGKLDHARIERELKATWGV